MPDLPPDWNGLVNVVEGNESATSCAIVDGIPRLYVSPIPGNAAPTLVPLVDVLRSDAVIPREIREWLAEMMTPGSGAPCTLSIRRARGRPRASVLLHADAVDSFRDRRDAGVPHKRAVFEVCDAFGITRATLLKADATIAKAEQRARWSD